MVKCTPPVFAQGTLQQQQLNYNKTIRANPKLERPGIKTRLPQVLETCTGESKAASMGSEIDS
jgi:hypothetical protein